MGIGLSRGDWFTVVHKNREEDRKRRKNGLPPRYPDPEFFDTVGNVKTTPEANDIILSRCHPKDENGNPVVSTARGHRRKARGR